MSGDRVHGRRSADRARAGEGRHSAETGAGGPRLGQGRRRSPERRRRSTGAHRSARLPLVVAASLALIVGAGAGASAVFLDRASAGAGVGAGTVVAAFDATGVTTVPVPVTGLVPGGTAQRLVDVTNAGTVAMGALQLETTAPVVGASASDGLQLAIERCSQAWSADAATCSGIVTTVAADRPATARVDLPASPAFAIGATDHLRVTLRLSESAPTTAQSTSGSLNLTVVGVQAPGRHR